jgi:hypothetical protein
MQAACVVKDGMDRLRFGDGDCIPQVSRLIIRKAFDLSLLIRV